MLVVRQEQAEELRMKRRAEWERLSEARRIEIEEKKKASRDGNAIGGQVNAWWKKSPGERAIVTKKQMTTRKERFVKNGRLLKMKQRKGERYRATEAAKTEEERSRPVEIRSRSWEKNLLQPK